jgi:hypothetical protein
MLRKACLFLCCGWLGGFAASASAAEEIGSWSGERNTTTPEFEVRAPWILDWRVSGELSRVVAVDVSLVNANTGMHEGTVLRTKTAGNGVKLFEQSGRFYFRVDTSMMKWYLKVIQLTEEEAEAYTPKPGHVLDQ